MATAADVKRALQRLANPAKAKILARFFKTGRGEYGAGDQFLGIVVPQQRMVAKQFRDLPLSEVKKLLASAPHEHRLTALLILTYRYPDADAKMKKKIYEFYLHNMRAVNNWDLVDLSAPSIVGEYLVARSHQVLYALVRSPSIWERRIAVLATFAFIKRGDLDDTFRLARLLLRDEHDLLHKAAGWMLREAGKRDERALENFLQRHAAAMPRTMLRYALERLPDAKRRYYLRLKEKN